MMNAECRIEDKTDDLALASLLIIVHSPFCNSGYHASMIEAMESRRLLAAPAVVAITMTGTAGQITGVVLTFGMPLDPVSAQNVNAYSISRKTKGEDSSIGPIDTSTSGKTRRVHFQSAVYDPAAQTVTLTPTEPFDLGRRFRRLRINGAGPNAVADATGAPIDGNGDGRPGGNQLFHSRIIRASHFFFREGDGDKGRLTLSGPGALRVWADKRRHAAPVVFLTGTDALRSTLTGSVVRNRRRGDGVVTLRELTGTSSASVPLLTDPAFRVEVINP
jgi:hypothetical protein